MKEAMIMKDHGRDLVKGRDVIIKVFEQEGLCRAGHKVGDQWVLSAKELKTPEGICLGAYNALFWGARVLMHGGCAEQVVPTPDPDTFYCRCPDNINKIVFEIKRVSK